MGVQNPRLSLRELLLQPEMIDQLRDRFRRIQDSLTTTIQEASALTELSQAQLRYAEARGMLAPHRAPAQTEPPGARGRQDTVATRPLRPAITHQMSQIRGQRRYTVDNLLRAHLIAFLLEHGYTLTEIDTFTQNNTAIITELLQTNTMRLLPILESAEVTQFNRFYVPRVLYAALSLIFEREAVSDAGIILPVRANRAELDEIAPRPVEMVDDLTYLGQTLVVWCARGGPVATFLTSGNPFEREQRVRLKPLRSLQAEPQPDSDEQPFLASPHIFVAYEPQVAAELDQADRTYRLRLERKQQRKKMSRAADPRSVAARLITQAQRLMCEQLATNPHGDPCGSDVLLYTAPELINPALGDVLLNRLADTIVELGALRQETSEPKHWRFACIMTPRKPYAPFNQQELVVRAQSRGAPHRIDVTTTSSRQNGGLTFRAYTSGRVAYRPEVIQLDPAVSYSDVEDPIKSAVAAPVVEGLSVGHSQPPAVIYITSSKVDDFRKDDFLLIRVMGRLVGEIVQTYYGRSHQLGTLTDTLDNPEIVDPYFAQFLSDSDFIQKVTDILAEAAPKQEPEDAAPAGDGNRPEHDVDTASAKLRWLTIVGLDVNDFSAIERRQGDRVARMLIREIGSRAQQRIESSFSRGAPTAWLYRAWGDRFYMIIRDEHAEVARAHAERIRSDISGVYRLEGEEMVSVRSAAGQTAAPGADSISVSVRLAGMTLSRKELLAHLKAADGELPVCVASLTRLLYDGLRQANETPDREHCALWWNAQGKRFEQAAPGEQDAAQTAAPELVAAVVEPPTTDSTGAESEASVAAGTGAAR